MPDWFMYWPLVHIGACIAFVAWMAWQAHRAPEDPWDAVGAEQDDKGARFSGWEFDA